MFTLKKMTRRLRQIVMLVGAQFLARPILKCAAAKVAAYAHESSIDFRKPMRVAKNDNFRRLRDPAFVFSRPKLVDLAEKRLTDF
ncbi:MAG TPA: hypothetical protein VGG11_05270 [Xanthobacteraceae bacterium]